LRFALEPLVANALRLDRLEKDFYSDRLFDLLVPALEDDAENTAADFGRDFVAV
jgi:hypothetical protein